MKKVYNTPIVSYCQLDTPIMFDLAGSGTHAEASAPERFNGTKKPINVMYI